LGLAGYSLLFIIVLLGGALGFFLNKPKGENLRILLAFSGAYLLGISVLHLMPQVFYDAKSTIGLWVLAGFLLQLLLELFSKGVEHAHMHPKQGAGGSFALQIMIGLWLQAFLEGMPLGVAHEHLHATGALHSHDSNFTTAFFLGILLHKLPAAFALVIVLKASGYTRNLVLLCLILFAFASPLGGWVAEIDLFQFMANPQFVSILLALVLGSFIHIATTILFEMDQSGHHNISWKKLFAILIGLGLSIFIAL